MKKIHIILIVISAIILVAGISVYLFFCKPKNTPEPESYSNWQTYRNSTYGLAIKYPFDYNFFNGQEPYFTIDEFFVGAGKPLFSVELPKNSYPNTNYNDAFLMLSVSQEKDSTANCSKSQRSGTTDVIDLQSTQTIDGTEFFLGEADGAAAGTLVKTKIYHAISNNACYEATLTIVEGNIDNYPQGTIRQFSEQDVWKKLMAVLGTITFGNVYNN